VSLINSSCLTPELVKSEECGEMTIQSAFGEKVKCKLINVPCRLFTPFVDIPYTLLTCAVTNKLVGGKCLISLADCQALKTEYESFALSLNLVNVKPENDDVFHKIVSTYVFPFVCCESLPKFGDRVKSRFCCKPFLFNIREEDEPQDAPLQVNAVTRVQTTARNESIVTPHLNISEAAIIHPDITRRESAESFARLQESDASLVTIRASITQSDSEFF